MAERKTTSAETKERRVGRPESEYSAACDKVVKEIIKVALLHAIGELTVDEAQGELDEIMDTFGASKVPAKVITQAADAAKDRCAKLAMVLSAYSRDRINVSSERARLKYEALERGGMK